ncbi:hypothetical protein CEE36_05960 [candidate division TA06 bacterium B3_TA06]|uniref:Uncharacterized protein n=1 Tax=candidate division TA06 bacterium B3_TA06 TaxID=2012487 RepID=A0A532V760_UNCT6|nr:MAG: hypothetical protein CEE36_05960 [candidate division TA06 bacterium B3_TA06]
MQSQEGKVVNRKAEKAILELNNIVLGSLHTQDYGTYDYAVKALVELTFAIEEKCGYLKPGMDETRLHNMVFQKLHDVAIEAINNVRAIRQILHELERTGFNTVKKYQPSTLRNITDFIRTIDTLEKRNSDAELIISTRCDEVSFNLINAISMQDLRNVTPVDRRNRFQNNFNALIKQTMELYENRLDNEWENWKIHININRMRTDKLMEKFVGEDTYIYSYFILPHYCKYIPILIEHEDPVGSQIFRATIQKLTPSKIKDDKDGLIVSRTLKELKPYSEEYLANQEWNHFWNWFLSLGVKAGSYAIGKGDLELFHTALDGYEHAIYSDNINIDTFTILVGGLINQTSSLADEDAWTQELALKASRTLDVTAKHTLALQKYPSGILVSLWQNIKTLVEIFIKLCYKKNWTVTILNQLDNFFAYIMTAYAEGRLRDLPPLEDALKYRWLTVAITRSWTYDPPAQNLFQFFSNYNKKNKFLEQYEEACNLATRLEIPQNILDELKKPIESDS